MGAYLAIDRITLQGMTPEDSIENQESTPAEAKLKFSLFRSWVELLNFLRDRMNLDDDKADPEETADYIKKSVEFKGTNIWILVFAIMIASVGLNMNSTAVVIGAMLISPLMGPIMGVGLGAGINDFELIKRAAKNLGFMVVISVATSALYFALSPMSDAQSELLARTQPTIWDVIIALFGGLAGIIAGSRKEKSNAIPGVAIATALMPPLCTAGFGLATQNWSYFFGAFYLFTINSVFISVSTFIVVRFLRYPQKDFIDPAREKRVRRWIAAFIIVITLPSLFIAFNLVRDSVFEREANQFIEENFNFPNAQVISKSIHTEGETKRIEVALFGEPITTNEKHQIETKLEANDRLRDSKLIIRQNAVKEDGLDMATLELMNQSMKSGIIEDLYKRNEEALKSREDVIAKLQREVVRLSSQILPVEDISNELKAEHSNVTEFTLMKNPIVNMDSMRLDTVVFGYVKFSKRPKKEETDRLERWLKARTKADSLKLVIQTN